MPDIDLNDLANQVRKLKTTEKLTLAAALVERGKFDVAESIAELALNEIKLARMSASGRLR